MIKETSLRGVGTALFSGMIAASFLGIFLIPLLTWYFSGCGKTSTAEHPHLDAAKPGH